jgi:hypothetical protein
MTTLEAALECGDGVGEGIGRVDGDAEVAVVGEVCEPDQLLAVRLHDEIGPHARRLGGNRDETSAGCEQRWRACEEVVTDRVEDQIHRARPRAELAAAAVHYFVRSKRTGRAEGVWRRSREHVGATPAGQLRRELADTTDRPVDQHLLAGARRP